MFALETDVPIRLHFRYGLVEPLRHLAAIGIVGAGGPLAHVHRGDFLAVEDHRDRPIFAGDGVSVPFSGLFHGAFTGSKASEDGATLPGFVGLGPFFGMIIGNLDLDRVGDPVLGVRAMDDHTAVGAFSGFELEIENVVLMLLLGPDALVRVGRQDAIGKRPYTLRGDCVGKIIDE